jgi:hypothetical protein
VPEGWIQTVMGANPEFANAGGDDFTLAADSPLVDSGVPSPAPPAGFAEIPDPLDTPAFVPPGPPHPLGAATARPTVGVIDIGAYEFVAAPPALAISISDTTVIEGDTGSVDLIFTLTLTDPD